MSDPATLADRYVALWNEPDPQRRRAAVKELWTEDGAHLLQPPQEAREIAGRSGIGLTAVFEARGHNALVERAASAHEEWVARGGMTFRRRDDVERVADAVKFHWEAVGADGQVAGVGLELLLLGPDGRIRMDYQFIES
jgi:V8-like Glu-specific endopeptidase